VSIAVNSLIFISKEHLEKTADQMVLLVVRRQSEG